MVASSLVEYGYRVATAGTGTEASTVLRQHERDLRLILTVPAHNGMVPLETLYAHCPSVPVILMSGELESASAPHSRAPIACLLKPFSLEHLLNTVAKALQQSPV
jgi:DNA-binding NtrC family response regulator